MRTTTTLLFTMICTGLLVTSCANQPTEANEDALLKAFPQYGAAPLVRVMLSKPSAKDTFIVEGDKIEVTSDNVVTKHDGKLTIARTASGLTVDGKAANHVELRPTDRPAHMNVDGRIYRGRLRIMANSDGWEVINVVDLEQYVAGVIGWEMIASWPVEALKAQAVASRTYALFTIEENRASGRNWDLDDTTRFQVYGGVGPADKPNQWRETSKVLQARAETSGEVLTYHGKGFKAFFHSTSGGHTVDPQIGLGVKVSIEPLSGVDLGDFDKDSPKAHWTQTLDASEVKARFIESDITHSDIIRIEAAEVAESGHAKTLKLFDRRGRAMIVDAIRVRQALGLYSTNFSAEKNVDEWVFKGQGYGHGCGMCQWSARGMAKAGWDANKILRTMYPGSELQTIY